MRSVQRFSFACVNETVESLHFNGYNDYSCIHCISMHMCYLNPIKANFYDSVSTLLIPFMGNIFLFCLYFFLTSRLTHPTI